MLPFANRLTRKTDFQKVYASRASFSAPGLILKSTPNSLPQSRIGFSVEKKYFRKAVERNTAKRKLREAVRPLVKKMIPGHDVVIIARDPRSIFNLLKLKSEAQELFRKAGLL